MKATTESRDTYHATRTIEEEDGIIADALAILENRLNRRSAPTLDSPSIVADYLKVRISGLDHEVFGAIWLDAQNRVISLGELFSGTLAQTSVYPREVVKHGLRENAAAVIFYHNHPSGCAEPSRADELLTRALKESLGLVDIRVLDHFVVPAFGSPVSFAGKGML